MWVEALKMFELEDLMKGNKKARYHLSEWISAEEGKKSMWIIV